MKAATLRASDYAAEWRACCAWARWVRGDDARAIMGECGLTAAGSPPTRMTALYEQGEARGPITYEPRAKPLTPGLGATVDRLVRELYIADGAAARALICRHLHRVGADIFVIRPEWWRACYLYGLRRSQAHARLVADCDRGYRWLRERL